MAVKIEYDPKEVEKRELEKKKYNEMNKDITDINWYRGHSSFGGYD